MTHVSRPGSVLGLLCVLSFLVLPGVARAQTTALYFDSQPGDFIGQGLEQTWTPADLTFTATVSSDRDHVRIGAQTATFSTWWSLEFAAAQGVPLAVGVYEAAIRYPFQLASGNGLSVSGSGRGCNRLFGRFQVHEIVVDSNGMLERFAADFEQHCEGASAGLFGAVRYNSTHASLNPFAGNYPVYGLRITPATNGYVVGPGIDCGAGRTDCEEMYAPNAVVSVEAVPSPGYIFLGWAGYNCVGTETIAITIRWLMSCIPVFNLAPGNSGVEMPDYSSEALFLDGYFGVGSITPPDGRTRVVYAPPHGAVWISFATVTEIEVSAEGLNGDTWRITLAAPPGANLAPGTYAPTAGSISQRGQEPVLSVSGRTFCTSGGRFTIHELEAVGNLVTRFSADFEAPCGSPVKTLTGSVRYRSTRANLLPFDGEYPRYQLNLRATLGGFISGENISCGDGGRTDCNEEYSSQALVSLQAFPTTGYEFLGWAGSCSGTSPVMAIVVDRSMTCIAVFHPFPVNGVPADASFSAGSLMLDSPGSTQLPTRRIFLTPEASVSRLSFTGEVRFTFKTVSEEASVAFSVPSGRVLPGDYDEASDSFSSLAPGLSITGCHGGQRSFRVYQADYDASGAILAFAADFEANCSDSQRPYLAGAVRFNSTRTTLLPFEGLYPRYRLAIVSSMHGTVTGPGIACGPSADDCTEEYVTPGPAALQAIPATGYRFVGWTGACEGGAFTTVSVNRVRQCAAVFGALRPGSLPQDPRLANNLLLIQSHPGDPVGNGQRELLLDGSISIALFVNGTNLDVHVNHHDGSVWSLDFASPSGQRIAPGVYDDARGLGRSAGPGIQISRFSPFGSCPSQQNVVGRFVIHELTLASPTSSTVTALALDFEQRCTSTSPPLVGSVRYKSSRGEFRPFASQAPSFTRFDLSGDSRPDLLWQNRENGQLWVWHMSGSSQVFNEPIAPPAVPDTDWHVVGSADGNADGYADLYWQHQTTGALAIWYMRETELLSAEPLSPGTVPDTNWKVRTVSDMDADGHPDLIWQHSTTGNLAVWFMNGRQQRRGESLGPGPVPDLNWTIVGAGDANQDGWVDLYWHHLGTGDIAVWYMREKTLLRADLLSPSRVADLNWRLRGVADVDGNGSPDLLWQNLSTLQVGVWLMNGLQSIDGRAVDGPTLPGPSWYLVSPR